MLGGIEEPCVPPGILQMIQDREGKDCPRVDLDPDNEDAALIISFLTHSDLKPLAEATFESVAMMNGLSSEDRTMLLGRVNNAMTDHDVMLLLHPPVTQFAEALDGIE